MAAVKGAVKKKIEEKEASQALTAVKGITLDAALNDIGITQTKVQTTLAGLSATLSDKITQLQNLDTAISLKEARLNELHQIEATAITLDDIKAQLTAAQEEYQKQTDQNNTDWQQRQTERQKQWDRQAQEYQYATDTARRKDQDTWQASLEKRQRDEQVRQETLVRGWTERENTLKAKEDQFRQMQDQVAQIDSRIKAEVDKQVAIVSAQMRKAHEHELAMKQMEANSNLKLSEAKVVSLQETIQTLTVQVGSLQKQLDAARNDAKEVANQALQAASSRQLADTLQKVVAEQAQPAAKAGR